MPIQEESSQVRHEKLIDFLNGFQQYQGRLKKVPHALGSHQFKDISTNDINSAVVVFTDVLNLSGGSVSDVNLYRLLQAYLQIPEFRGKIDRVVSEAHSFDLNKIRP